MILALKLSLIDLINMDFRVFLLFKKTIIKALNYFFIGKKSLHESDSF